MPTVSIIIPVYNGARFLPEAIDSVFAQTYKDYEIIVIDDGSTDNTKEVLEPYFDKIKYIYQNNRGVAGAMNAGIRHAHGEYIAFLDQDDIWLPQKLAIQINYMANNPEIGLVYSKAHKIDEDGKLLHLKRKDRGTPSGDIFDKLYFRCSITSCSGVILRKRVFDTIRLFDETIKISTDYDLWLRIARRFKIAGINTPLYKQRKVHGSLSTDKELVHKEHRRLIEENYVLYKDADRPISSALYKRAIAKWFFRAGRHHFKEKDRKKALANYLQSLKYNPFNLRTIKHCISAFTK